MVYVSSQMTKRLEEFIRFVITAPTLEEGKIRMANHMADMRTILRTCDDSMRPRIIAKVAFLTMRGMNTGWSKVEVVNLMNHERTSYKRIGYLAAQLVLDSEDEVMTLMTQIIQNDLSGTLGAKLLALTMIANMVSPLIAETCAVSVEKLIEDYNPAIQKKALMAAVTICRKCPDLADTFKSSVTKAINSMSHGVVNAGLQLAIEILNAKPEQAQPWAQLAQPISSILRSTYSAQASKEYRFSSGAVNDPFLQCTLMKALQSIGAQSEELDDIMSSIITGVDVRRNTGRSLLFAAINCIGKTAKKQSLQALAYNQIGRLFEFQQPNVIYSALSAFSGILYVQSGLDRTSADSIVLQRYKLSVVKCLNHPDPSIRRRALDVIAALIDETNVTELVPEVLGYLQLSESDFRGDLVAKVFTAVTRFSPSPEWTVRTTVDILFEGGNFVGQDVLVSFARTLMVNPAVQPLAVSLLGEKLAAAADLQPLAQAAAYVLGEYSNDGALAHIESLGALVRMPQTLDETKLYAATAIAKLAVRDPSSMPRAVEILKALEANNTLEIQQRAGEFLRTLQNPMLAAKLLQPVELAPGEGAPQVPQQQQQTEGDLLIDLGIASGPAPTATQTKAEDLLLDLGLSAPQPPQPQQEQPQTQSQTQNNAQPENASPQIPPGAVEAFRNSDVVGYFEVRYNDADPHQAAIRVSVFGLNAIPLTNFNAQFGASQGWAVQARKLSSSTVEAAGGSAVQTVLLVAPRPGMPLSKLAMKVIVSYLYRAQPIKEVLDVNDVFR